MAQYPLGAQYMHCVENHDYANQPWNLNNKKLRPRSEERWGEKRMDVALTFLFTLDGTPMIYCGQEICDKRPHSIFGKKNEFYIHWKEDGGTDSAKKRTALIRTLSKMRKENKVFTKGNLVWLDNSTPNDVLSYKRVLENKQALVLLNFNDKKLKTEVTETDGNKKCYDLAPFGVHIVMP